MQTLSYGEEWIYLGQFTPVLSDENEKGEDGSRKEQKAGHRAKRESRFQWTPTRLMCVTERPAFICTPDRSGSCKLLGNRNPVFFSLSFFCFSPLEAASAQEETEEEEAGSIASRTVVQEGYILYIRVERSNTRHIHNRHWWYWPSFVKALCQSK